MSQVLMPQRKDKNASMTQALQLGGAAVGAAYGGVPGAMAGASAGGMAGGMLSSNKPQTPMVESNNVAMQRRADSLRQRNKQYQDLSNAEQAVEQLPPEQQQSYAPAIQRARMLAAKERGIA